MTITALHIALGQTTGPLTVEMVAAAAAAGIDEAEDLDWKETLPLSIEQVTTERRDKEQFELAKDVAAMANTRGGLIVYGVDEAPLGLGGQHTLVGVQRPSSGDYGQRIRQVVNALVHPPVVGLREHWLSSDGDNRAVLALEMPESFDRPHLVRPKDSKDRGLFAAPWRDGSHSMWMGDRQLEDAYRSRIEGRRQRENDLTARFLELERAATNPQRAWVVAVAVPDVPVRRSRNELDEALYKILNSAWKFRRSTVLHEIGGGLGPADILYGSSPRRSLHRFRQHSASGRQGRTIEAVAEVHRDGAVGLAWTRDGLFGPNDCTPDAIATDDLERFGVDLLGLVESSAAELGVRGDYVVRFGVTDGATFRRPDGNGWWHLPERVPAFVPLTAAVRMGQGHEVAAADIVELAEDAVSQGGSRSDLSVDLLQRVRHL